MKHQIEQLENNNQSKATEKKLADNEAQIRALQAKLASHSRAEAMEEVADEKALANMKKQDAANAESLVRLHNDVDSNSDDLKSLAVN
jgi:anti-sigma factor RsiW